MRHLHQVGKNAQHRGMQIFVELGDPGIVPVHCEQVLGQVVGADGQKIHTPQQGLRLIQHGGDLDHDPDGWVRQMVTLLFQLCVGPIQ